MIKYETKSAYSNELINRTKRGENNDSLYEDFIVVENMKSQFYYVFYGDGEPSVSSFEHDEKLPNGLVLTVYANDGHIELRRTFKRLSSEEAKEVKSGYDWDYEYALKHYKYREHYGDYAIWR